MRFAKDCYIIKAEPERKRVKMKIFNVTDKEYASYGRVLTSDYHVGSLLEAMAKTPAPADVIYIPSDAGMEKLPEAQVLQNSFFGGLPIQVGYCNGTNNKLNALEYHRSSELGIAVTDLILLVGRQTEISTDFTYDTEKVKAFLVPAGTVYEMYATTLHYAPCSVEGKPFKNVVILPRGTNEELPANMSVSAEDPLLFAVNKWLIAHEEANIEGAFHGLKGVNITLD